MKLFVLGVALALLMACSNSESVPSPTATSPAETSTATPRPNPASPRLIPDPSPPKPLTLQPLSLERWPDSPIIFDTQSGSNLIAGQPTHGAAWQQIEPRPLRHYPGGQGKLALYDHDRQQWLALTDFQMPNVGPATTTSTFDDGGTDMVAISSSGQLVIIDFRNGTWSQYAVEARPVAWSPDETRLAVTIRSNDPALSPHIVFSPADPSSAIRLPLGQSPNSIAQSSPVWLSDLRIMMVSQKAYLLQVVDLSGSSPRLVTEERIPSDQVALSRSRALLAVQDGFQTPQQVAIFQIEPFDRLEVLDGAFLGYQWNVPSEVWSTDDEAVLALSGPCGDEQKLMLFDLLQGVQRELAVGRTMQFVLSPDSAWVALTRFPGEGHVIPVDLSQPGTIVSDGIAAPVTPVWSDDSHYAVFTPYLGGYGHCD